jgi:hypothetical protein
VVRDATTRFHDVAVAEKEGYFLQFGCVSGPDFGAMGMHFVNMPLVMDGELDATRPEIVIYEPQPDGSLQLIGADYLVLADAWDANGRGQVAAMLSDVCARKEEAWYVRQCRNGSVLSCPSVTVHQLPSGMALLQPSAYCARLRRRDADC